MAASPDLTAFAVLILAVSLVVGVPGVAVLCIAKLGGL